MKARLFTLLFGLALAMPAAAQPVLITEFKAVNNGPVVDNYNVQADWIELHNPTATNVNLSGWFLTDNRNDLIKWSFPSTVLPPDGFLIVFASSRNQRLPGQPLHTSFSLGASGDYLALVWPDGVTIAQEFAPEYPPQSGRFSFGFPMSEAQGIADTPGFLQQTPGARNPPARAGLPLALTEIMYHPSLRVPPDTGLSESYEFLEFKNIGTNALDLTGATFQSGVSFTFANFVLDPGQRALLVSSRAGFESRYGTGLPIVGEFVGNLSDSGERLWLIEPDGTTILDVTYDDDWNRITDGRGFSLVLRDETAAPSTYGRAGSWRASGQPQGSPGREDLPKVIPPVYVNEILSRPELPFEDVIELFNPNTNAVDISGWYLTDDFDKPEKFRMPPGAIVPALGFLALDEHAFNAPNDDPDAAGFGLGDFGEEVYLFSGDAQGALTGWVHGFKFGAAETNVTFGRHVNSVGEEHFVAQAGMTFLETNAGPKVGPIVLSEIHYHPPNLPGLENTRDEYVELRNLSNIPVPLYDLAFPTNRWQLIDPDENEILFVFPEGAAVPAGGRIIVAGVHPADPGALAAFIASNNVPAATPIFGPLSVPLNNGSATLELLRPDAPQPGFVPFILVDRVRYADTFPWPTGADGTGSALHRIDEGAYGDDPINWWVAFPTPGAPSDVPPLLLDQPSPQAAALGADVSFQVSATGTPPLAYQWLLDGQILQGATDKVLRLTNVQSADAGGYSCRVSNGAAVVLSRIATLTVIDADRPVLVVTTPAATPARFSVSPVTFSGTATDNAAVSVVLFQQDDGPYLPANGTTDWSATLNLAPGFHTTRFVALDPNGNASATNTITVLIESNPARLALLIEGVGKVSGASHGRTLVPGRSYTINARPATGHHFSHWSDWTTGVLSTNPALTFVMASNLALTAHFVPGPFVALAGSYDGLFFTATNPAHGNAGYFALRINNRGTYTGKLTWRGRSHGLRGRFDAGLSSRQVIQKPGTNDLIVTLQLAAGSKGVTGSVNDAFFASELLGRRTGFDDPREAAGLAGRYTGAFFVQPEVAGSPQGTNTIIMNSSGRFSLRGKLPDGKPVARRLDLAADGSVPLHLPLSGGAGSAFGWLNYTNSGAGRFQGPLLWTRTGIRGSTNWIELRSRR